MATSEPPPAGPVRVTHSSVRAVVTSISVTILIGLVGAAACVTVTEPPETVESLREQSPTLRDKHQLRIGVRGDLPLLSYFDEETGEYSGFEIEIATALASELGFPESRIAWVSIRTLPERESVIQQGLADIVVANFSMTEQRDQYVDFAGPYLLVPQAVLVRQDRDPPLATLADLAAEEVRVCAPTASTPARALVDKGITPVLRDTNPECMEGLRNGEYDAFSTDLPILAGFRAEDPEQYEILELAIADHSERIGVAVPEGDTAMQELIAYFLERWRRGPPVANPWLRAYDRTIGPLLDPSHRTQPLVDNPPELADFDSRAPGV